jgi:hypothetical protein
MKLPMCGSTAPEHRSRTCSGCRRIYKSRHLQGLPRLIRYPAMCVFCGLAAGNSLKVKVLRYPLLRHIEKAGRHTSVCIGSMGICDRCVIEHGNLNERARAA